MKDSLPGGYPLGSQLGGAEIMSYIRRRSHTGSVSENAGARGRVQRVLKKFRRPSLERKKRMAALYSNLRWRGLAPTEATDPLRENYVLALLVGKRIRSRAKLTNCSRPLAAQVCSLQAVRSLSGFARLAPDTPEHRPSTRFSDSSTAQSAKHANSGARGSAYDLAASLRLLDNRQGWKN